MSKSGHVPVTERAVLARVNRVLQKTGKRLKTSRGERAKSDLGRFYVLDENRNFITHTRVNIATLAGELGCLQVYEAIV